MSSDNPRPHDNLNDETPDMPRKSESHVSINSFLLPKEHGKYPGGDAMETLKKRVKRTGHPPEPIRVWRDGGCLRLQDRASWIQWVACRNQDPPIDDLPTEYVVFIEADDMASTDLGQTKTCQDVSGEHEGQEDNKQDDSAALIVEGLEQSYEVEADLAGDSDQDGPQPPETDTTHSPPTINAVVDCELPQDSQVVMVRVDDIEIGPRKRPLDLGRVKALAMSIEAVGLLQPIIVARVDGALILIAGLHRLKAHRVLGWDEIRCIILDLNDLQRELVEIDENLIRSPLTVLERGEHLARRKEIYESLHPQTRHGGDRSSSSKEQDPESGSCSPLAFTADSALKTGRSRSVVAEEVKLATDLSQEVRDAIRGTGVANRKIDLKKLASRPLDEQRALAAKIRAGEAKTLSHAEKLLQKEHGEDTTPQATPSVQVQSLDANPRVTQDASPATTDNTTDAPTVLDGEGADTDPAADQEGLNAEENPDQDDPVVGENSDSQEGDQVGDEEGDTTAASFSSPAPVSPPPTETAPPPYPDDAVAVVLAYVREDPGQAESITDTITKTAQRALARKCHALKAKNKKMTLQAIGETLGISKSQVYRLLKLKVGDV